MGWHSSDTGELAFTDVEVPSENLLGPENGGFYLIMANFQWERLLMALGAVGAMRRLLDVAVAYSGEREAFGRPIGRFQALRHKIAEIAIKGEVGRALTYHALREFIGPEDERRAAIARGELSHPSIGAGIREVTMAKLHTQRACVEVADEVVQILGGYGYMREYGVELGHRAHAGEVEIVADPPHEILRERRAPPGDLIQVASRHGVVPRVKLSLRQLHLQK